MGTRGERCQPPAPQDEHGTVNGVLRALLLSPQHRGVVSAQKFFDDEDEDDIDQKLQNSENLCRRI